ncbi:hypothetical protein ACFQ9X_34085 [Catenulispora yoronensis]
MNHQWNANIPLTYVSTLYHVVRQADWADPTEGPRLKALLGRAANGGWDCTNAGLPGGGNVVTAYGFRTIGVRCGTLIAGTAPGTVGGCTDPGPASIQPAPPGTEPSVPASPGSAVDDAMKDVGGQFLDLWVANQYPGFAGVIADETHSVLDLYWQTGQTLPAPVQAIVNNPGGGITVTRVDAPFGRIQLQNSAQSLMSNLGLNTQICGFLHTVKILEDGTGLTAGVDPYTPGTFDQWQAGSTLTAAAGVPVTVEVGPQPQDSARISDTSPFYGGAGLTAGTAFCSSGFGVTDGTKDFLLTANHCFANAAP